MELGPFRILKILLILSILGAYFPDPG
jgi:hypothetical protein